MGADKKSAQHERIRKQQISIYRGSLKYQYGKQKIVNTCPHKNRECFIFKKECKVPLYSVEDVWSCSEDR